MFRSKIREVHQQLAIFIPKRLHNPAKEFAKARGISERELFRQLLIPQLKQIAAGEDPLSPESEQAA